MLKEFKEFAFKGNMVDMAVGFILGAGFSLVVKSLVTNVVMPALSPVLGGVDFKKMNHVVSEAVMEGDKVIKPAVIIEYGKFINDAIAFIMLAFVVFIIVKKLIAGKKKEEEKAPAKPPVQEVLLTEIRDALVKK